MIEVTSRHMECTHFNTDYSRMPAVALQMPCPFFTVELISKFSATTEIYCKTIFFCIRFLLTIHLCACGINK